MRLAVALLLSLVAAAPARAGCDVDAREVAFGTVEIGRQVLGTGNVVVRCDAPTGFTVGFGGSGGSGGFRHMHGPDGAQLTYQLFSDRAYSRVWGDGSGGSSAVSASTDGEHPATLPVYGVIPGQSRAVPGFYTDQLTIVLSF